MFFAFLSLNFVSELPLPLQFYVTITLLTEQEDYKKTQQKTKSTPLLFQMKQIQICPLSPYFKSSTKYAPLVLIFLEEHGGEKKTFVANSSALIGHLATQRGTL